MIERKDVMPVNFLKKENFTGSDTGTVSYTHLDVYKRKELCKAA